ncbi:/ / tRNA(ANN) t(6)A37 threonylcarbamoyladenosine modification protein / 124773:125324 Forward [Candidatus Hepatoplasma crinochetorum]|uniref:L-threonylcarbamoyladenylate synthase n=1 Tax=Candidatus Hepatoplasma crinochetorum TaxID=295596 RepID=A0A0G7ZNN2_9MOLU|nr:/ / tRNA(ANN) t(6)A37 threonylcarbamoyladenosine modification protein / 124773:125324 Forward [Candidatus Hepatoplasma crinochetorum]
MKFLKINKLVKDINENKIIAMPTETVYGLFSKISKTNLKKLNKLKRRDLSKQIQVFFLNFAQIEKFTDLTKFQKQILIQELPSNKSFLVPSSDYFKKIVKEDTILVRFPIWEIKELKDTKKVFLKVKIPLFATSANFNNEQEINSGKEIQKVFEINGFNRKIKIKKASTIISLLNNKIEIIRK